MSGTALDHRLVRDYLAEFDAAMRGQAGTLKSNEARSLLLTVTAMLTLLLVLLISALLARPLRK